MEMPSGDPPSGSEKTSYVVQTESGPREILSTRGRHTPEVRATSMIWRLADHFCREFEAEDDRDFGTWLFLPLWNEELGHVGGDDLLFNVWRGDCPDALEYRRLHTEQQFAVHVATAYAVQAIKTDRAGDRNGAWDYALDAAQWVGFLEGRAVLAAGGGDNDASNDDPTDSRDNNADSFLGTTKRTPRVRWRRLLTEHISTLDAQHGGSVQAEDAMRWLMTQIPATDLRTKKDTLPAWEYLRQDGVWKPIKRKEVRNVLSEARSQITLSARLGPRPD